MTLTKEKASLIDRFLTELRDHSEPTLYLNNYKATHSDIEGIETLPKLMQMVYSYQKKHHYELIRINGEAVDQLNDLDWFVDSNGFTALWEQEEKERQFQNDIKTVNNSVKETNYWIKRTSIASAAIALFTLVYIALEYYKDTSTNLEPLREQIKSTQAILDSIRVSQKGIEASLRTLASDSTTNVLIETKK